MQRITGQTRMKTGAKTPASARALLKNLVLRRP
jgi:hypothetical protein